MTDDPHLKSMRRLRERLEPRHDPLVERERTTGVERRFLDQRAQLERRINRPLEQRHATPTEQLADRSERVSMGRYGDIGIQQIELAQIKNVPSCDALTFNKTSMAEMIAGFDKLREIVAQAPSEQQRFCQQQDQRQQLTGRDSYQHVYRCFYGNDNSSSITLNQVDDGYVIEAGYHRLAVARELGWECVPARVKIPHQ